MADVTISSTDIRPLDGCIIRRFVAGGTLNMGAPVYLSAADTVAHAAGGACTTSFAIGVAVATPDGGTTCSSGEYVDVVLLGPVTGYTTNMAHNAIFYVDNDAGVIADAAGTKDTIVGIGLSASVLFVRPIWIDLS